MGALSFGFPGNKKGGHRGSRGSLGRSIRVSVQHYRAGRSPLRGCWAGICRWGRREQWGHWSYTLERCRHVYSTHTTATTSDQ